MAGCLGFRKKKSYTVNKIKRRSSPKPTQSNGGSSNPTITSTTIKPQDSWRNKHFPQKIQEAQSDRKPTTTINGNNNGKQNNNTVNTPSEISTANVNNGIPIKPVDHTIGDRATEQKHEPLVNINDTKNSISKIDDKEDSSISMVNIDQIPKDSSSKPDNKEDISTPKAVFDNAPIVNTTTSDRYNGKRENSNVLTESIDYTSKNNITKTSKDHRKQKDVETIAITDNIPAVIVTASDQQYNRIPLANIDHTPKYDSTETNKDHRKQEIDFEKKTNANKIPTVIATASDQQYKSHENSRIPQASTDHTPKDESTETVKDRDKQEDALTAVTVTTNTSSVPVTASDNKQSRQENSHIPTVSSNSVSNVNITEIQEDITTQKPTYNTRILDESEVIKNTQVNGDKNGRLRDSISSNEIMEDDDTKPTIRNPSIEQEMPPEPIERRDGITPQKIQLTNTKTIVFPKDPEDENLIRSAVEKNDFLSRIIRKKIMDEIIDSMYNKEVSATDIVIKQGDKGSHMYVSAKGRFQIIVKGKPVEEFSDVRVFGELAILYNDKRRATIKALTDGRVWVLDQNVYQQIVYRHNIKERDEITELLLNNVKLNSAKKEVLEVVATLLEKEFFASGDTIVRQGDKGNKFYIIRAGTVTITKDGEGVVGSLRKGDCFGELALLKEDTRQATVKANAPGVDCLSLARKNFIKHFGELKSWNEAKVDNIRNDSIASIGGLEEYPDLDINDLKIKATIGVGGFGRVELVQHTKIKDKVFALKYLKKFDIVMQHQQEHVQNEKKIQISSRSPFIVRMYKTYKDDKYIYFLMEACLGGDLWGLLQKQKNRRFEEKDAKFICGCVLEAFDYLHIRGIVYRDLKPENLLIDAMGYIKLTDFGFAKKVPARLKTYTFAGTPEYVAPEIVLNRGHDRAVDYWAYGAFVYEMLTGRTPFRTDDSSHMRTYNRILKGIDNAAFPSYVAPKARHLIEKLCRPIPADRLGMQKGGIKDIRSHKWYLGFDWQKLQNREIPSPFKPKLKGPTDISHFDKFKKDTDIPPDETSGWDSKF